MSKTYTEDEVISIFTHAYYIGVQDGENGIPEDFVSCNPRHLEWYAEKCVDVKMKFFDEKAIDEYLKNTYKIKDLNEYIKKWDKL